MENAPCIGLTNQRIQKTLTANVFRTPILVNQVSVRVNIAEESHKRIRIVTTAASAAAAAVTTLLTVETCNVMCLDNDQCNAWEFRGSSCTQNETTTCLLFTNNETNHLGIHQAVDNDPTFVVGFAQKRAHVLRPVSQNGSELQLSTEKKVLYILHFHHEVIPHAFEKILNEILPSSWMASFMDLVVITPLEVSLLVVNGINKSQENERIISGISTLVNPFCPRDNSLRGSNGQMSLPIARAKFPGYGGYLLVNDDAMVKFWELESDLWFGDRPWGTFPLLKYSQQSWQLRHAQRVYPYGNYGWSWYNYDSGTVHGQSNVVRSNFDAALDAMNELCRNETGIVMDMDNTSVEEFCGNRSESVLSPYVTAGGKADVLYVPGNKIGAMMSRAMTLFGEHDVFMEIAYPMIMNTVVPREAVLEMPLCDGSLNLLKDEYDANAVQFKPYFQSEREEGKDLDCPVIHPIKFGMDMSITYWKETINNSGCSWCIREGLGNNETFWELAKN